MSVRVLTDSNFDAEIRSSGLVLVDFHATWCGPCKKLAPIVAKIASEFAGKVKVCKVDIDDAPAAKTRYNIRSVPTVMVFKNGHKVAEHSGLTTQANIVKMLGL